MFNAELKFIISDNIIFDGLSFIEKEKILSIIHELDFSKGEPSLPLRVAKDTIFIICRGELTITLGDKTDPNHQSWHLSPSDVWYGGEIQGPDDETVHVVASAQAEIMELRISDLFYQLDFRSIHNKILQNIGQVPQNEHNVFTGHHHYVWLFSQDEKDQRMLAIQNFVSTTLLTICTYMVILHLSKPTITSSKVVHPVTFSVITLAFGLLFLMLSKNHFSLSVAGVTSINIRSAVVEALKSSVFLIALAIAFKWIYLQVVHTSEDHGLFEPHLIYNHYQYHFEYYTAVLGYLFVSVPLQEFIFRGGLQGYLQQIFQNHKSKWQPIVIANILFATVHLSLSPLNSLLFFLPGFYWGWMFAKHHNLAGACLSHAIYGFFTFFVLGYFKVGNL